MTYKELILQKYVHGYDADIAAFPHAAVKHTVKKKRKKFDDPATEEISPLVNFRDYRNNIIKDYAIDFVTKMYDIHKKSGLTEEQQQEVEERFEERRLRLRGARGEKKREEKRLAYEAWVKRNEENSTKNVCGESEASNGKITKEEYMNSVALRGD